MSDPLPTPYPRFNGYVIREASCEDVPAIARVHVDSFRTTYPGILPASFLDSLSYERREDSWRRDLCDQPEAEFAYVVETHEGQIVGFATGGPEQEQDHTYTGEVYRLYLLEAHQAKGLGRALVAAVAQRLDAIGLQSLLIWVLADNPACGFYAALGGTPVKEKEWELQDRRLKVLAFGWPSTQTLLQDIASRTQTHGLRPSSEARNGDRASPARSHATNATHSVEHTDAGSERAS